MTSVWSDLVGQEPVVEILKDAVASAGGDGRSMTHAWLFTGPPGSGRSNAASAFAAALQCEQGGCGECHSCATARAGSHPDITVIRTDGLSIGTDVAREYVRKSALRPALGRWQVLIVEDADRLTDQAANALLKAIEEPSKHTIWMLCAPAVEDVIITIRSRCRPVLLRTPSAEAIAGLLVAARRHRAGARVRCCRSLAGSHRAGARAGIRSGRPRTAPRNSGAAHVPARSR